MGKVLLLQRRTKKGRLAIAKRDAAQASGLSEKQLLEFKVVSLYQLIYALMLERPDPLEEISFDVEALTILNPRDVKIEKHEDPRVGESGKRRVRIVVSLAELPLHAF
jgi:hypothetical protein